jgi:hypothetical protein
MVRMPIALRRSRADSAEQTARTSIALAKGGAVAPFVRRPGLALGERRPARRLSDSVGVPAVSRIVLRSPTLR